MAGAVLDAVLSGPGEIFDGPAGDLRARYGPGYLADAAMILRHLERFAALHGETLGDALASYRGHVDQAAAERRSLHAGPSPATAADQAMADAGFRRRYLYALTLSTVLNRSRYELFRDYRGSLERHAGRGWRLLEVGAGNCLDAAFASRHGSVLAFERNDLSRQWHGILELQGRVDLRIAECRFAPAGAYDMVTLIELLEHLADPAACLRGAWRALRGGGLAYLTFAIRMPQVDHLTWFASPEECRELVCASGFAVLGERCLPDTVEPFAEADRWALAADPRQAVIYCCLAEKPARAPAAGVGVASFNEPLD